MATGLSVYVYLLHNDSGEPVGAINKRYPRYSRNTISRHATKDPNAAQIMWQTHKKYQTKTRRK